MPEKIQHRFAAWLTLWALATACLLAVRAEPRRTPLFEDEIYWIGSAYYFDLFRNGEWTNPDWALLPARENPPVAKYAIGLSLSASGQQVTSIDILGCFYMMFSGIPGAWGESADFAKRAAVAERMTPQLREQFKTAKSVTLPPDLLLPARVSMIAWLAVTSLLTFLIAYPLCGKLTALVTSQALLLHPIAGDAFNHATSDAVALAFSVAAALAILATHRRLLENAPTALPVIRAAFLAGVLLAFACASKMNSLVVGLVAGASHLYLAVIAVARPTQAKLRQVAASGLVLTGVALGVFIAINPALHRDLWNGLAATVLEHRQTELIQRGFLSGRLDSLSAKVAGVGETLAFATGPSILLIALAITQLVSKDERKRFIAAWWLMAYVCVVVWIPFQRLRYVAPLLIPTALLCGCIAHTIAEWMRSRWLSPKSAIAGAQRAEAAARVARVADSLTTG